jgi:dTDP-glucose pyrophosphorylase
LDAKAEAHKMTAYSFEKLQSMCEFSSGRILFDDKELTLLKLMEEIGNNVKDIKEKNQFILPEAIRYRFPYLYSTNVFAEVKQIQNSELILTNDMQNLIEEGKYLKRDIDEGKSTDIAKYEKILKDQKYSFEKLIKYREHYMEIDERFKREIDRNIRRTEKSRVNCCQWLKN